MQSVAPHTIQLIQQMKQEFPKLRILSKKDSLLCKLLGVLLKIITFGQCDDFSSMSTTVGYKIYLSYIYTPINYESYGLYELLRHERIHLQQHKKYGLIYSLLYLFVLPFFWTYRAKFESEAYTQSIFASIFVRRLIGGNKTFEIEYTGWRSYLWDMFNGPTYAWMYLSKLNFNAWFDSVWRAANTNDNCKDLNIIIRI